MRKDGKIKLRPCPFCGGKGARVEELLDGDICYAVCDVCHAATRVFDKPENAAEAWNHRAEPENRVLTLEEVKAHCEGGVEAAPLWVEFRYSRVQDRWGIIVSETRDAYMSCIVRYIRIWSDSYGTRWRCWVRKPTPEETAGTPWEV